MPRSKFGLRGVARDEEKRREMKPVKTVRLATRDGVYVVEGCPTRGGEWLALATSAKGIHLYDTAKLNYVRDLEGHNAPVTDLQACDATGLLYSSQSDTGVMISDLRTQKPAHYLTELQGTGASCASIAVNSSGTIIAVAADRLVHLVDARTWNSAKVLELHTDEVSKLRFVGDNILVSSGEDFMTNFSDVRRPDKDVLLTTSHLGECLTRISYFAPGTAAGGANGVVCGVGSVENAYVFPLPTDLAALPPTGDVDFPMEKKIERTDFETYRVDFVSAGEYGLTLLTGKHSWAVAAGGDAQPAGDGDGVDAPQGNDAYDESLGPPLPLTVNPYPAGPAGSALPFLGAVHRGVVRFACNVGDVTRSSGAFVTAGEDGVVALWDLSPPSLAAAAGGGSETSSRGSGTSGRERVRPKRPTVR